MCVLTVVFPELFEGFEEWLVLPLEGLDFNLWISFRRFSISFLACLCSVVSSEASLLNTLESSCRVFLVPVGMLGMI